MICTVELCVPGYRGEDGAVVPAHDSKVWS